MIALLLAAIIILYGLALWKFAHKQLGRFLTSKKHRPSAIVATRESTSTREILNRAVALALEWGEQWLTPIQSRLAIAYPFLSAAELDSYDHISQQIRNHGFDLLRQALEAAQDCQLKITEQQLRADYLAAMQQHFPLLDAHNLTSIFSQGLYYCWKDGLDNNLVSGA